MYNEAMFRILKNIFFVLWNISIVVFSTTLIIEDYLKDDLNVKTGDVMGITLILGVIFFLIFIIFNWRDIRVTKNNAWYSIIPTFLLFISIIMFINKPVIQTNKQKIAMLQRQIEQQAEQINNAKLSNTQPIVNTQPVINSTLSIQPIQEADPMVNCLVSQECGGGTKYMRESVCKNTICCEINSKWYFYYSVSDCKKDQEKFWEDYWEDYYEEKYKDDDYEYNIPEFPTYKPLPPLDLTIPDYSTDIPEVDIEAEIKKCEDRAREDTKSQIDGCYVKYEGSAANMCAKGYQDLGAKAITNCRNMY